MHTLDQIVESSDTKQKSLHEALAMAEANRDNMNGLLPFERSQFSHIFDGASDYVRGLDDQFKRVDFKGIVSSVKKVGNDIVPSFAIYNINASGNDVRLSKIEITNDKMATTTHSGYDNAAIDIEANSMKKLKSAGGGWAFVTCLAIPILLLLTGGYVVTDISSDFNALMVATAIAVFLTPGLEFIRIARKMYDTTISVEYKFSHTFTGVIPSHIKSEFLTDEIRSKFDKILLVEESYNWDRSIDNHSFKTPAPVRNYDPLLIGERNGKHYLIAKFDVSPAEQLIVKSARPVVN